MVQVVEKDEEFVCREVRRHGDIRHGPFLSLGADQEELPTAIGSLRLHQSAEHIEQEGFSFLIAHARKLGHIHGDVNLVITAWLVECGRVSKEGVRRGERAHGRELWPEGVAAAEGVKGCVMDLFRDHSRHSFFPLALFRNET